MSKFVKGTSIVGALVIGIGIWQITESEGAGQTEHTMSKAEAADVDHTMQTYQSVTIQQNDKEPEHTDYEEPILIKNHVIQSIEEAIVNNDQIKPLLAAIAEDTIDEELASDANEYEWDRLAEDTAAKRKAIKELQRVSDHQALIDLAKKTSRELAASIEKKDVKYYFAAISRFQYLLEELELS